MKTYSDRTETYIGRGAGKEIDEEISKAKESIKIVSPYLSPSYVEDLLKLSKKGINVTLITSNEIEKDKSGNYSNLSDMDLIKQQIITDKKAKNERDKGMLYSGIGFGISLLLLLLSLTLGFICIIISILVFSYFYRIKIYSYSYYSPIRLRVTLDEYHGGKHFVHSKIFVMDDRIAFVGSVNYTHRAFKKSYETITRITTYKAVEQISKEVERLFNDKDIYSKSIEDWGRELYEEPPH